MSILVNGGAGYIGSHMVWKLLDSGEEVVVVDRLSTGFDWAVPAEAELVVGDIADQALVAKLVADHLRSLGMEVRTGVAHTGVVGVLKGGKPGPVVALRADMYALPIVEKVNVPFASK